MSVSMYFGWFAYTPSERDRRVLEKLCLAIDDTPKSRFYSSSRILPKRRPRVRLLSNVPLANRELADIKLCNCKGGLILLACRRACFQERAPVASLRLLPSVQD